MARNIIDALYDIVKRNAYNTRPSLSYIGKNVVQANGFTLEDYIMALFSGNILEDNVDRYLDNIDENFTCLKAANFFPDYALSSGDVIEVKKNENNSSQLQFNSSYPKNKIFRDSPKINPGLLEETDWEEKDVLYVWGIVPKGRIKLLSFVYGSEFCADRKYYERVITPISRIISKKKNSTDSDELGKIKKIDPLNYTTLRIRGMWLVSNPIKIIDNYFKPNKNHAFTMVALMDKEKFESFHNKDIILQLAERYDSLNIQEIKIPHPSKKVRKNSILITYIVE